MKSYKSLIKTQKLNLNKLTKVKTKIHLSDAKQLTFSEIIYLFFNYILLIFWALIIIFPVITMIVASFNVFNPRYVSLSPKTFTFGWDNFSYLFTSERSLYVNWYINTVVISLITMAITVVFVALNGYAYSRFRFTGSKHSLSVIMLLQMVPATASLISLYIIVTLGKEIKIDPRFILVLIYAGGAIAGNTFIFKGYLDSISKELDDSAKIDGCGNWKLFYKILLPISKPMLSIIALWTFLIPFGDVILPRFTITDLRQTTLAVGLDSFISTDPKHINAGAYSAGALLAAIPPFILFMVSQKNIVGNLGEGSVKG
ncbi:MALTODEXTRIN ABC TRANSPORTER PERMEASE PROTEIN MALD [Mycoplasmopsis pulmonis]|uniref:MALTODEXTRIN ABC TRANSPORTER PERMEASE PROTEIN MALD n=1 Tax=Mycoplasmopsis pulmonis (strain UAB CTIP) TaxID=272635 RepID=Q98PS9_MYCPU|nr:sugar ABC transporter permease [Mycoplasmopsis pulmonis]MDZ7293558.1 sugar ABC transporter permease [Mycoplasmopsis pulmonis]CAC13813.1 MALTODEXTRIN ABC TRANSPORTER PERMEASE PROTEIN MALD [Mycoplasmopsis pulmonis]VEU68403.1 Maltose transport system permease protein malG [Mycoplasmopsis pulmonis]